MVTRDGQDDENRTKKNKKKKRIKKEAYIVVVRVVGVVVRVCDSRMGLVEIGNNENENEDKEDMVRACASWDRVIHPSYIGRVHDEGKMTKGK
jgi:hypothetical protein